jgi:F420-non-reducing hydrogenase iron-sulfur subunit
MSVDTIERHTDQAAVVPGGAAAAPTAPVVSPAHAGDTEAARSGSERFEPVLIGFTCNWCSYRAADLAGTARMKYPPNIRLIRLMCSGRIDPTFVLRALSEGADGVMITGCHPGECHYIEQNLNALRRYLLLRRTLEQFGIDPRRLRLVWASAAEGAHLAEEIAAFVEEMRDLGPLEWPAAETVREGDPHDRSAVLPAGTASETAAPVEVPA